MADGVSMTATVFGGVTVSAPAASIDGDSRGRLRPKEGQKGFSMFGVKA